jgi:tryptophan 2,3-dioxygenase
VPVDDSAGPSYHAAPHAAPHAAQEAVPGNAPPSDPTAGLTYGSYLALDELLALQRPRSGAAEYRRATLFRPLFPDLRAIRSEL